MTVVNTSAVTPEYTASGADQAFNYDFYTPSLGELLVLADGAVLDTGDYVVTRAEDGSGTVRPVPPLAAGTKVRVVLDPDFKQEVAFSRFGAFTPDQINPALDRAAAKAVTLRERVSRALLVGVGSTALAVGLVGQNQALVRRGDELIGVDLGEAVAQEFMERAEAAAGVAEGAAQDAGDALAEVTSLAESVDADLTAINTAVATSGANATLAGVHADRAEAAVLDAGNVFNGSFGAVVPRRLTGATTISAGGSGFADGTYALTIAGAGWAECAGTYTCAGGAVTSIAITNKGESTTSTPPTLTFLLGGGTGAVATATVEFKVPLGGDYWAADATARYLLAWRNLVGVGVSRTQGGVQMQIPLRPVVDEAVLLYSPLQTSTIFAAQPHLRRILRVWMTDASKQYSVQWCVRDASGGTPRWIMRFVETADTSKVYYAHTFGSNPNPTTGTGLNGGVGKVLVDIIGPTAGNIAGQMLFNFDDGALFGTAVAFADLNATKLSAPALGFSAYERSAIDTIAKAAISADKRARPWGPKATAVPSYLNYIKTIKVWNANGISRDVRVSLSETSAAQIRVHLFDQTLNDQIGQFLFAAPDYSAGGANLPDRISLTGSDPLGTVPVGDPSGANYTGLQGYMELHKDLVVQSGAVNQPTTLAEGHIDPANIYTPYTSPARVRDVRLWQYADVLEAGPTRAFVTPRAAVEALYTPAALAAMAAAPLGVAVMPESLRASPINPVAIIVDFPNPISPAQFWQDQNLHLPDFVSLIARYPGGVVGIEHVPGATRPAIQAHLSHQLVDLGGRNTQPEGVLGPTSSARYWAHRDYLHLYQSPDAEGDIARYSQLDVIGCRVIAGAAAQIQPIGMAIPVNDTVNILDTLLLKEGGFTGPMISANTSSSDIGGGRLNIRNCWDRTGRVADPVSGANSSVGVQSKLDNKYPNILDVDGCKGFALVASSGPYANKWHLRGNNNMAVYSSTVGDTLGI